jgi:hypothetical protein
VRERRQPKRYSPHDFRANFVLSITDGDPKTVKEAVNPEDSKLWKKAMFNSGKRPWLKRWMPWIRMRHGI